MSSIAALAPSTMIFFPALSALCKKETVSTTMGRRISAYFLYRSNSASTFTTSDS